MYKILIITCYGDAMCQNVLDFDTDVAADRAYKAIIDMKFVGTIKVQKLY